MTSAARIPPSNTANSDHRNWTGGQMAFCMLSHIIPTLRAAFCTLSHIIPTLRVVEELFRCDEFYLKNVAEYVTFNFSAYQSMMLQPEFCVVVIIYLLSIQIHWMFGLKHILNQ